MDKSVALLLIRILAGVLFFVQAYDKIFKVGMKNVADAFGIPMGDKTVRLQWAVALSSYGELIGGLLLIIGLFKSVALYVLAADMLIVGIAFSILRPIWDMQHYFPRLILITTLLLLPSQWDTFSLDHLLAAIGK